MTDILLFPMTEYWSFYVGFAVFVLAMLALDLGVFHRKAHEVSIREAAIWSAVWVVPRARFQCGALLLLKTSFPGRTRTRGLDTQLLAETTASSFSTGYVVEKALAVDNIFVFVVVFSYFAIPPRYQHRVLFYGILGALVFRAIFIALGSRADAVPLGRGRLRRSADRHRRQDARAAGEAARSRDATRWSGCSGASCR